MIRKIIYYSCLLASVLTVSFSITVKAQQANEKATKESADEKTTPEPADDKTPDSDVKEADNTEEDKTASQEEGKGEVASDEAPESAPDTAAPEADDFGSTSLSPPATFELDMSALGEVDPEKELASKSMTKADKKDVDTVENWTERSMDVLELHGYFRVRPELYHKFYVRNDDAVFMRPLVIRHEGDLGNDCRDKGGRKVCENNSLAGANMRFRLEPTINVSEEILIKAQIDFLDNVMLGSTPRYWQNFSGNSSMIETGRIQGWDMGPPESSDMIVVRRVWGEVMTPFGQLRFGRMGDHWGTGMLHNAGNGINQDFGDSVDRLMFITKINGWLIAPAFDFPSEGVSATSAAGRPFDVGQLDDSYQLVGIVAYKHDPEEQKSLLKRGDWVVNTGIHFTYKSQVLSFEAQDPDSPDSSSNVLYRRDMWSLIPDFWFQFLHKTFQFELELALIYGEVGNPDRTLTDFENAESLSLVQYGGIIKADYGLLSNQLRIGMEFGFASGDKGVEGLMPPSSYDQTNVQGSARFTAFSFNPAYNTDLILYHHLLGAVSQSYYFHPFLQYDFLKSDMGKNFWLKFDVVYSRAVFGESTISNSSANLGLEFNIELMYVSTDRFHAGVRYGLLFPLGAFKGTYIIPDDPATSEVEYYEHTDNNLAYPQTLQLLLGITY